MGKAKKCKKLVKDHFIKREDYKLTSRSLVIQLVLVNRAQLKKITEIGLIMQNSIKDCCSLYKKATLPNFHIQIKMLQLAWLMFHSPSIVYECIAKLYFSTETGLVPVIGAITLHEDQISLNLYIFFFIVDWIFLHTPHIFKNSFIFHYHFFHFFCPLI